MISKYLRFFIFFIFTVKGTLFTHNTMSHFSLLKTQHNAEKLVETKNTLTANMWSRGRTDGANWISLINWSSATVSIFRGKRLIWRIHMLKHKDKLKRRSWYLKGMWVPQYFMLIFFIMKMISKKLLEINPRKCTRKFASCAQFKSICKTLRSSKGKRIFTSFCYSMSPQEDTGK